MAGKGAESQLYYISILTTVLYYTAIRSEAAATHSSLIVDASPRVRENKTLNITGKTKFSPTDNTNGLALGKII